MRVIFALILLCGSSKGFQLRPLNRRSIARTTSRKASSPFLSLDKYPIPVQQRNTPIKVVGAVVIAWCAVYLLKLLTEITDEFPSLGEFFSNISGYFESLSINIQNLLKGLNLKKYSGNLNTWQPCTIKSCTALSSSHAMLSLQTDYSGPKHMNIDIGQEVRER